MEKKKGEVAALQWPDREGLWWTICEGHYGVCRAQACCGGDFYVQCIGEESMYHRSNTGPGEVLYGYTFVRAEPPTLPEVRDAGTRAKR